MSSPNTEEKVAFLRRPETYADGTLRVETKQTHMSWVFLTDRHAWKLKKPVRYDYLDFSTVDSRRRNCEEEVRLNRRFSTGVYFGIVPLTVDKAGNLTLGGHGQPTDWLVQMRRLPSDRMLDSAITGNSWSEDDIRRVGELLAGFYKQSVPIPMTGTEYRMELRKTLLHTQDELSHCEYSLSQSLVESVVNAGLKSLDRDAKILEERASKVIEAHGDLRAEHICLEGPPIIIDSLEFNRTLRILDPVSELTFLNLECERLGAERVGELVLQTYREKTGDRPAAQVLSFYKNYHACIRAQIAVWHLRDHDASAPAKWIHRAEEYLQLAA